MAVLLQTLGARLGIVTGRDLAQACRETYPRAVNLALWFLCEIAIVACDLAEVLGAAIALNLLFHIPLLVAVAIHVARHAAGSVAAEAGNSLSGSVHPGSDRDDRASAFRPKSSWRSPISRPSPPASLPRLDRRSLYIAVAMLGATVMPHNLYLHSALVQTRRIGHSVDRKSGRPASTI